MRISDDFRLDKSYPEDIENILNKLGNNLPHGSGINYVWNISYNPDSKKIYASNNYDGMSEFGYYCHVYNFTCTYVFNGFNQFKPCPYCEGKGIRYVDDLHKYHKNMSRDDLIKWLESDRMIFTHENRWFYCNVCEGKGKNKVNPYELKRINFHGSKEYSCCGFSLKSYLWDICYLDTSIE